MSSNTPTKSVSEASTHLFEAFTHRFGPLDSSGHQPIIKAISDYAAACRAHDEQRREEASREVYVALTHQFGKIDLGAHEPFVVALSEYGAACAAEGEKA